VSARWERELDEEVEHHLEQLTAAHIARGLTPDQARAAARLDFGAVVRVREEYRDQRGFRWWGDLRQDASYAVRSLHRNRGFAVVAVLTLALGIGATTAIFSVVNSALLRPLPYAGGERLVRIHAVITAVDGQDRRIPVSLSAADRDTLAMRARTLDHVASAALVLMNRRGADPRWLGARVSASAFPMLGVQPLIGRVFDAKDERLGAHTLILGERAWRRDFGADPGVIGRTITIENVLGTPDRTVYTIVGVMPERFEYPNPRALYWLPFRVALANGPPPRVSVVARLAEGISVDAAATDLSPVLHELWGQRQGTLPVKGYEVVGEHAERVRLVRPALIAVSGAVGFVLLIACVNVGSLMLTRTAARQREIAIRSAIGAGRGRLVRLAMTEGVVLATLGSIAGAVVAYGSVRLLQMLTGSPYRVDLDIDGRTTFPGLETISFDTSVLWFAVLLATAVAAFLAIAPALHYMRTSPGVALRSGSGATARGSAGRLLGMRGVLIVTEVALAMILLVAGGLLMASFVRLTSVDAGFDADNVLTFQVSLSADQYPADRVRTFSESLTTRLKDLPGVHAAAYANQLPMVNLHDTAGGLWRTPDPSRRGGPRDAPDARIVSHEFLETLGIPVVAGRGLSADDRQGRARVLLVNDALARRDFGGRRAIGQQVFVGADPEPWEIVGITANVRQLWLNHEAEPQFFIDARQWNGRGLLFPVGAYYAVRTTGDPRAIAGAIERTVRQLEPQGVVFNVAPMQDLVSATVGRPRLYAVLLGLFAAIGLTLAVIGVYGVIAYGVEQRTREISVRMALGAQRQDVLAMIMRGGLLLTLTGIGIGVLGAAATTRLLESMLFGVTPLDVQIFVATAGLFALVAAIASFVPARRATRLDPLLALRAD
jgi:putative ABC transport system permease protein